MSIRQADISRAIAGALRGGLQPGTFSIEITSRGSILIAPLTGAKQSQADDLNAQIRAYMNEKAREAS